MSDDVGVSLASQVRFRIGPNKISVGSLTIKGRILGCLLGGALGDALGAPFEHSTNSQLAEPATNSRPIEFAIPSNLQVTDDTQLTMATCEAIVESQEVDLERIASKMTEWFRGRRIRGMGSSTLKALTELSVGGHWALVGATGERAAGNGAAMRMSPLAFFLNANSPQDRVVIRDVARITHRHDEAYLGALAILLTIANFDADKVVNHLIGKLPDSMLRDRLLEIHDKNWTAKQYASRYRPTGFVVDSVPLSILAATECVDFMETIGFLVECGGDTDTTAAMFGNIIGAVYGVDFVPIELAKMLPEYPQLNELAVKLNEIAMRTNDDKKMNG